MGEFHEQKYAAGVENRSIQILTIKIVIVNLFEGSN